MKKSITKRSESPMLLFLGAGASKPVGMPDMKELTNIVIKELKEKNYDSFIINTIKQRVKDFDIEPDIEAILTCIDSLIDLDAGISNAGPFAALISDRRKKDEITFGLKKEQYVKISKEIRDIIRKKCSLPGLEHEKKLIETYDFFFDELNMNNKKELSVYTTNYDCCFEVYCREKGYNLYDDFVEKGGKKVFDLEAERSVGWDITKLHGSSNYMITNKNEIIKTESILNPGDRTSLVGEVIKESMIYPTNEKYFSKSPYIDQLNGLRNILKDISGKKLENNGPCIVIGYSFRDVPINNAFIDAYKKGLSEDICFIDPNATTIIKNNIPELQHIIKPINKKFEDIEKGDLFIYSMANQ